MSALLSKCFRIIWHLIGTTIASIAIESSLRHLQFTDYIFDIRFAI